MANHLQVSAVGSAYVAKSAITKQLRWVKAIEKRVGITSTMLSGMKGVKLSGLTPKLGSLIQKLRESELVDMAAFRKVLVYCTVLAYVPQQFSPVVTFGAFIGIESSDGRVLDTTRIFTSISLLVLLNQPLAQIFQSFPILMSSVGCLDRIQKYLSAESRADHRLLSPATHVAEGIIRPIATRGSLKRLKVPDNIQLADMKSTPVKSDHPVRILISLPSVTVHLTSLTLQSRAIARSMSRPTLFEYAAELLVGRTMNHRFCRMSI